MACWNGWNESAVRPKRAETMRSSTLSGFTPINAGAQRSSAPPEGMQTAQNGSDLAPQIDQHNHQAVIRSVASTYLRRGDVEASQDILRKPSSRSKKRRITGDSSCTTNRRKNNYLNDTIPDKKRKDGKIDGLKRDGSRDLDAIDKGSSRSTAELEGQHLSVRSPKQLECNAANVEAPCPSARPVSVFSSETSMDCMTSSTVPTSLDSVRAACGHGLTIYRSAETAGSSNDRVDFSQPWLNENHNKNTASSANLRPLRPWQTTKSRLQVLLPFGKEDNLDVSANSFRTGGIDPCSWSGLAEASKGLPKGRSEVQAIEEDFIGEDDDDAEALEILDALYPASRSTRSRAERLLPNSYLPTPANSKVEAAMDHDHLTRSPSDHQNAYNIEADAEGMVTLSDDDDEGIIDLLDIVERDTKAVTPPREKKQNFGDVAPNDDYGGASLSEEVTQLLNKFKAATRDAIKPIVRKPFPAPILDRSPIFGASSNSILRTCFRIGEALQAGCQAVRANKDVLLELYARVTSSRREDNASRKQHFVFKDLYHDNPPHLTGTSELWHQSRLWDLDSKSFLVSRKEGTMCRVIAKMKRDGMKWRLEVLSIWEASWEDVDYVAGIYVR